MTLFFSERSSALSWKLYHISNLKVTLLFTMKNINYFVFPLHSDAQPALHKEHKSTVSIVFGFMNVNCVL